jgi:hypothetical protein
VSLGFIVLCRPEYLLFILVFTLFLLTLKHRFSKVVLYLLGVCIIVLPWSVRNFLVFKKPVLISTGGLAEGLYTATFYNSANWKGWGAFPDSVFLNAEEKEIANSLHAIYPRVLYSGSIDEVVGIEKAYFKLALKRVQRQPLAVFRNWLVKIPRLWFQDYIQMYRDREASGLFFIFYFSFGLYGFFSATAEKRILMNPLCLLFIYLNLLFIPLHIEPRYGVALMPGLVSLAGIGLGKFLRLNSLPFCKRGVV